MPEISTKPYLVRALFEWCNDSGYTPYVTVTVGEGVQVPAEYVRDGEIVLNVSPLATNRLTIGNDVLEFQARFGGVAREVRVPIAFVRAIYARETGQGMAFEATPPALSEGNVPPRALPAPASVAPPAQPLRILPVPDGEVPPPEPPAGGSPGERPRLTRVK
jgi:stringent starvation protein B